jgi:virulence factor
VRGFTAMCEAFLASVRAGDVLSARDALRTHEVCETVVAAARQDLQRGSAPVSG